MAVLQGSLDYLYYNGILNHIPYEAYDMSSMTAMPQMNGTQYLQAAQTGLLYDTYTCPDTFVRRNNTPYKAGAGYSVVKNSFTDGEGYGRDADYEVMANGEDGKSFRQSISRGFAKVKDYIVNSPDIVKGLLAAGLMLTTVGCLVKTKRVPKKV